MRIGTLFSGIGAPEQGAKKVYEDALKIVFACEWDKFARQSFLANYDIEEAHFHKDIYDMDGTAYEGKVDILIGGSPCQAFSIAGLRKGLNDKRGELIYEYIRIVDEVKSPIIIYENVKGMLSIDKGKTIKEFVQSLRDIGYHCHYGVLNSKDYGVPQNRDRLFLVGFLEVEHYHAFSFAPKIKLEKRLRDVLESEVDEKYYLSHKMIEYISTCLQTMQGGMREPKIIEPMIYDDYNGKLKTDGIACTLTINCGAAAERNGQKVIEPRIVAMRGINPINPKSREAGLDTVQMLEPNEQGVANTLTTVQKDNLVQEQYRIRKLTPRECLRLQDFPDTFKQVVSDSQMYKQAGNSMTVAVLEMIFRQIEKAKRKEITTLF